MQTEAAGKVEAARQAAKVGSGVGGGTCEALVVIGAEASEHGVGPVSYTHLDVYKRQLHSRSQAVLDFPAPKDHLPMRLNERLEPQRYEQRLQEIRKERKAETKQVERLSAILAKKSSSAKAAGLPERAA